jgi:hypothetical protein
LLSRKHGTTLPFENSVLDVELGYGYFIGRVQGKSLFQASDCWKCVGDFAVN